MVSKYIGNELEVFEHAKNWKKYYASFIKPLLGKRVAEVGAGLGGTTPVLCDGSQEEWLCIEPDSELLEKIKKKIREGNIPPVCKPFMGYLTDVKDRFDSVLYIDVIEHIADDKGELEIAADSLNVNGHLIILVPAHEKLFSPFDKLIGHYRRYSRTSLEKIIPTSLEIEKAYYLDSAGYFASLVNKLFLKQNLTTLKQITFWDSFLVPISRISDKLLRHNFGKSVLLIAKKK